MPLALTVDSLDSVPEPFREHYTEADGKFRLNVDGLEDVTGLKTALDKERASAREAAKTLKDWQKLGKTPEEISALLAKTVDDDKKKKKDTGDVDALLAEAEKRFNTEKEQLARERDDALKYEREAVISERLVAALVRNGATEEGIELLPDRLAGRIKFEREDGKRKLIITAPDGETPMYGAKMTEPATLDDLAKEAMTKYPSLFKGEGTSGSGTRPNRGSSGGKTLTRQAFEALSPAEKAKRMQEGYSLIE